MFIIKIRYYNISVSFNIIAKQIQKTKRLMLWNSKETNRKCIWMIVRLVLNCFIYWNFFSDPGFIDQLCGPLAIPANPSLFKNVFYIELAYFVWPIAMYWSSSITFDDPKIRILRKMNLPKNIFILLIKCTIIFNQTQRLKYYMHVVFIEFTIIISSAFFDVLWYQTISEAWEIVIVDSFHRVAIFYETTRTFCPNFAIYWFLVNLLVFLLSQIEAHAFYYYPNSQRMEPIYPVALYVKQDIYRIMIMTFAYFGLFAVLQINNYGYGMTLLFLACLAPFLYSIRKIHEGQYKKSLISLIIVCIWFAFYLKLRISSAHLFKSFPPQYGTCGLFDKF